MFGTSTIMQRGDSNESEESVGDMPIELRYLESDFFMDSFMIPDRMLPVVNVPEYNERNEKTVDPHQTTTTANVHEEKFENGRKYQTSHGISSTVTRSKSLDDLISVQEYLKSNKRGEKLIDRRVKDTMGRGIPRLSETGRSSTTEDQTISSQNDEMEFMKEHSKQYYNQQLFLLLRHRHRHFSASSQQSSRPPSTSIGSSKITRTPGSTFDYDDLVADDPSVSSRPYGGDIEEQEDGSSSKGRGSGSRSSAGILKGLKTFSASMKSIDISLRSTSISSISSGKSLFSNFSAKSDSGIGLPILSGKLPLYERSRHKSTSPSSTRNQYTPENHPAFSVVPNEIKKQKDKKDTSGPMLVMHPGKNEKRRTWESEPHLDLIGVEQQQKPLNLLKIKRGGSVDESSVGSIDISKNIQKTSSSASFQQTTPSSR